MHYTFDHDVIMPESNEESPPAPLPPDDGCLRFADGRLCNCTHDWLNMLKGTDPQVAHIRKELAKRWMLSLVISEHKEAIATIIAVITTLWPLLRLEDQSKAWERWFALAGVVAPEQLPGPVLNRASMLIDAAIDGQGIALARTTLAAWDLISGRIVRPFDLSWRPAGTYWIVCPKATAKVAKIGRFRDWLLAEAADDARRLGEAERRRR